MILEIMAEGRGTQFDPACLDAFFEYIDSTGLRSSKDEMSEAPPVATVAN